jgi:hypothetical protein
VLGLGLGLLMLIMMLRLPGAVGQGAGRGVPLTVHDRQRPGKVNFFDSAQPRRVNIDINKKMPQSPCRAKSDIYAGCYRNGTVYKI